MIERFKSYSRLKQIAVSVLLLHVFSVLALATHHLIARRSFSQKMIVVRERLFPPAPLPKASPSPMKTSAPAAAKTAPLPKPASKPSKQTSSPKPAKKTKETPALLNEIAASLEKLTEEEKIPSAAALKIPSTLKQRAEIQDLQANDATYGETVISLMQTSLDLPEFGEVKARIEIGRDGRVISCAILESKNRKNEDFLKTGLPSLIFPNFNDFGITDATLTFTITFRNAEIR